MRFLLDVSVNRDGTRFASAVLTSMILGVSVYAVVVLSAWHSDSICWTVNSVAVFHVNVMQHSETGARLHVAACMHLGQMLGALCIRA